MIAKPIEKCSHCGSKELSYDYTEDETIDISGKTASITMTFKCGECDEYSRQYLEFKLGECTSNEIGKA